MNIYNKSSMQRIYENQILEKMHKTSIENKDDNIFA